MTSADLDAYDLAFHIAMEGPIPFSILMDLKGRISGGSLGLHARKRWAERAISRMQHLGVPLEKTAIRGCPKGMPFAYSVPMNWIGQAALCD